MNGSRLPPLVVTGTSGFIGGCLVRSLDPTDTEVVRLFARVHPESGEKIFRAFDRKGTPTPIPRHAVWVHLSGIRGERPLPHSAYEAAHPALTRYLVERAREHRARRFVLVSSAGVHGWPEQLPIRETTPLHPVGTYHAAKLAAEHAARQCAGPELPLTIVRPVATYGPGDRDGLVPNLVRLLSRFPWFLPGDGTNRLHLLAVEDLVEGLLAACRHKGGHESAYILAGPEPCRLRDLIRCIQRHLGSSRRLLSVPETMLRLLGRVGEARFRLCRSTGRVLPGRRLLPHRLQVEILLQDRWYDTTRARKNLGFEPKISLDRGMARTVHWLRNEGMV